MSEQAAESLAAQLREEVRQAQSAEAQYLADLAATAAPSRTGRTSGEAGAATATADADDGESSGGRSAAEDSSRGAPEGDPAMLILTDTSLPERARVELLQRLAASISRRGEFIEALLAIVRDRSDSAAVRRAALQVLDSAAFQVLRFRPYRQAYVDALRDLVDDPDLDLRETAVNDLAQEHDPVVQETLLAGLRGDRPLPVERGLAIRLRAQDDHLDNLPGLKETYSEGGPAARQEAVRLMGSYPAARPTLEAILRDRNESEEVRRQSAASLRHVAPDAFEAAAKQIAVDPSDDPDVRTAALAALLHLGDPERVLADSDFLDRVEVVSRQESTSPVAQIARELLDRRSDR